MSMAGQRPTHLPARSKKMELASQVTRPFAMHRPAMLLLLSRIATTVFLGEPVYLSGETRIGKAYLCESLGVAVTITAHFAEVVASDGICVTFWMVQTCECEDSGIDVAGAFFLVRSGGTFSRKMNAKIEASVRKVVGRGSGIGRSACGRKAQGWTRRESWRHRMKNLRTLFLFIFDAGLS